MSMHRIHHHVRKVAKKEFWLAHWGKFAAVLIWFALATFIVGYADLSNFSRSLTNVLVYEGGYSNDPHDPGGVTLNGIIQREYDKYRDRKELDRRPLRRSMLGTAEWIAERNEIYMQDYWQSAGVRGNDMVTGVDFVLFDYGVNSGIGRSGKVLRRVLKMPGDWRITNDVIAKARKQDKHDLIDAIVDERERFLQNLSTCRYFCKGWLSRTRSVRAIGHRMAGRTSSLAPDDALVPVPGPGKAFEEEDTPQ